MNNEVGAASVAPAERGKNTALVFEQQPKERFLRTATTALLFEQQPKEGAKEFTAFKIYLELGPDRSLALNVKETGRAAKEVGGVGVSTN